MNIYDKNPYRFNSEGRDILDVGVVNGDELKGYVYDEYGYDKNGLDCEGNPRELEK